MKVLICVFAISILMITSGESHASYGSATFTHDYGVTVSSPSNTGGGGIGLDSVSVIKPDASPFSDTFTLAGLGGISTASISISHNGNFDFIGPDGYGEQWQAMVNNIPVGTLSNSFYDWKTGKLITGWVTDTFTLNSAVITAINALSPSPQAVVSFQDTTPGGNSFNVNSVSIVATGDTVPTPLPAALALFAPGLLGVAALRRRMS